MTGDDFAFNTRYDGLIAYDIDLKEGTRKAKCLAMYAKTSATDRADANTTGMVEEVYKSITEDDIEVDTVVLRMPGGSTKTLNIKDVTQPYEPGDIVCYTSTDKVIKPAKAQIIAKGKTIAATPAGVGLFGGSTNDHLYVYLGAIRNLKDGYAMVGAADAAPGTCYPYDISNLKTVLIQKRTEDGVKYTKETPQILGIYEGTNTKVLVISKFLNTVGFVILEEE